MILKYEPSSEPLQDDGEQPSTTAGGAGSGEQRAVMMDRGRHKLLLAEQKMARTKAADDAVRL